MIEAHEGRSVTAHKLGETVEIAVQRALECKLGMEYKQLYAALRCVERPLWSLRGAVKQLEQILQFYIKEPDGS